MKLYIFLIFMILFLGKLVAQTTIPKNSVVNVIIDLNSQSVEVPEEAMKGIDQTNFVDRKNLFGKKFDNRFLNAVLYARSNNVNLILLYNGSVDEISDFIVNNEGNDFLKKVTILDKSYYKNNSIDFGKIKKNIVNPIIISNNKNAPKNSGIARFNYAKLDFFNPIFKLDATQQALDLLKKNSEVTFNKIKKLMPQSDTERWYTVNKGKALIYLNWLLTKKQLNAKNAIAEFSKIPTEKAIYLGYLLSDPAMLARVVTPQFLIKDNYLEFNGCSAKMEDLKFAKEVENIPLEFCQEATNTKIEFSYNPFKCSENIYVKNLKKWFIYRDISYDKCLELADVSYHFSGTDKNICIATIQNRFIKIADNKMCSKESNYYIYCSQNSGVLSIGLEKIVNNNLLKLVPHLIIDNDKINEYFKNDIAAKSQFIQNIFDEIYLPCILNNTSEEKKCSELTSKEVDARLIINKEERIVVDLIKKELAKRVLNLDRDIETFHWSTNSTMLESSNKKSSDQKAYNYAKMLSENGTNGSPTGGDTVGVGLYLSPDPVSSKPYGDFGVKVTLKKNSKLLDIRDENSIKLTTEITQKLIKMCSAKEDVKTYSYCKNDESCYFYKDTLFKKDGCLNIFKQAFKESKIGGLIYDYQNTSSVFCPNRIEGLSFVLIDPLLNPSDISTFNKEDDYYKLWEQNKIESDSNKDAQYLNQIKEKTFGCDPNNYPNDRRKTKF